MPVSAVDWSDPSHFGKVYIRSCPNGQFEALESGHFSRLDLRIYGDDYTSLHPKFLDLIGKKVSLGFQIRNPDLHDPSVEEFQGRINLPIRLGDNAKPDLDHIEEAFEKELEICRSLKLVSSEKAKDLIDQTLMCAYWTFCAGGRAIMEQNIFIGTFPFTIVDDAFEDNGKEFKNTDEKTGDLPMTYKILTDVAQKIGSGELQGSSTEALLLFGQHFRHLDIPMSRVMELYELGRGVLNYIINFRKDAIATGKRHGFYPEDFLRILNHSVDIYAIEYCQEWREKDHISMWPTITKIHQDTVAGILSVEAGALQYGINLSERFRKNKLFKLYIESVGATYQKINDLFSYAREAEGSGLVSQSNNEVYLLHKGLGWPLQKALQKMVDDANLEILQLEKIGELLLKLFPDEEEDHQEFKRFHKMAKEIICGYLQWYSFIQRYHPGMVYDCYIDLSHEINGH